MRAMPSENLQTPKSHTDFRTTCTITKVKARRLTHNSQPQACQVIHPTQSANADPGGISPNLPKSQTVVNSSHPISLPFYLPHHPPYPSLKLPSLPLPPSSSLTIVTLPPFTLPAIPSSISLVSSSLSLSLSPLFLNHLLPHANHPMPTISVLETRGITTPNASLQLVSQVVWCGVGG